jgi:hypothetical protein
MNEYVGNLPYGPLCRHNICLLQQNKYLNKFLKTSMFARIFPIALEVQKERRIKCPLISGSKYFNYRQYLSIFLQVLVDANLKFVTVDVGA